MTNEQALALFSADELSTLATLTDRRRELMAQKAAIESELEPLNVGILSRLQAKDCGRVQIPTGAIVQIVQQKPRAVIVKEKLIEAGVSMKQIDAATVSNPVRPFVRVDMAQTAGLPGEDAAKPADTAGSVQ